MIKVLIIDDDDSLVEIYSSILRSKSDFIDFNVASNLSDGFSFLKSFLPDIVLLDNNLEKSGEWGVDNISVVKSYVAGLNPFVVLLTGDDYFLFRDLALKNGANRFVQKIDVTTSDAFVKLIFDSFKSLNKKTD